MRKYYGQYPLMFAWNILPMLLLLYWKQLNITAGKTMTIARSRDALIDQSKQKNPTVRVPGE
jgi:hypothetical protein